VLTRNVAVLKLYFYKSKCETVRFLIKNHADMKRCDFKIIFL
jgi:hypothetical protein